LSALASVELPITLVDEVIATAQCVIASDLWRRAQTAAQCLTEIPLAMPVATSGASSGGLPAVLRGVIDLVFRESAGWVIVDYKSERVDASEIPALVTYYKPQIDAYVDVWKRIVKQPVIERGLFFTHTGTHVTL
jgi:ATP-dependent helicase/nuclease subunit A